MSETSLADLPRYKCHKEVKAAKITAVERDNERGGWSLTTDGYGKIRVSVEYLEKHKPQPGGYYVVYDDGYASFSPANAFEEGYTRI